MERRLEKLSKFLSLVLRHKPEAANVELDKEGYVDLELLLKNIKKIKGYSWVTENDILSIIEQDRKQRFEITKKGNKKYIRARYGHNAQLEIEISYPEVKPDEVEYLYHGTNSKVLPWILREGLKPMSRHYVHLSPTPEDALVVAQRRQGKHVILRINARDYIKDGGKIWKATEKTYLAKEIPPKYIRIHKYGV